MSWYGLSHFSGIVFRLVFSTYGSADFSPVSSFPLMADAIIHKARIEVDRQGTKAAAASMALMVTGAFRVDIKEVILDRPFLYVIVHEGTGLPLFTGIVNQLEGEEAELE